MRTMAMIILLLTVVPCRELLSQSNGRSATAVAAQWASTLAAGPPADSFFLNVTVDTGGCAYAVGYSNSRGTFGFGDNVATTGICARNALLVKYSPEGVATACRVISSCSEPACCGYARLASSSQVAVAF
jgi:hypothetical protein